MNKLIGSQLNREVYNISQNMKGISQTTKLSAKIRGKSAKLGNYQPK
ncbi:hypothetical protein P4600_24755 [Niallia circulans]